MKDYSQHKESTFIFNYIKDNNFNIPKNIVEIGALDGVTNSNSRMFIELGWNATLIEPNPYSYQKLLINTSKHFKKVKTFNVAIADTVDIKRFTPIMKQNMQGRSHLSEIGDIWVLTLPIDVILSKEKQIGIMSIDAEGYDTVIVKSLIENTSIRPKILMVENISPEDRVTPQIEQEKILSKEYEFVKQISVNGIWKLKTL